VGFDTWFPNYASWISLRNTLHDVYLCPFFALLRLFCSVKRHRRPGDKWMGTQTAADSFQLGLGKLSPASFFSFGLGDGCYCKIWNDMGSLGCEHGTGRRSNLLPCGTDSRVNLVWYCFPRPREYNCTMRRRMTYRVRQDYRLVSFCLRTK
jgi:hypothetical protein